jgi:transcriptional regulator with XRE-family HTH domain
VYRQYHCGIAWQESKSVSSPGETMRRLRLERGLEVEAVAGVTGLEASRIEDLEADIADAWFQEALLLAQAYGIAIEDFARQVSGSMGAKASPTSGARTDDVDGLP